MPLDMDIHKHVQGLTAAGVEGAHQKDLAVQGKYGVTYLKYWYDEGTSCRAFNTLPLLLV